MSVDHRTWPESLIALYAAFLVGLPSSIYYIVTPYVMGDLGTSQDTASFGPIPSMLLFLIGLIIGPRLSSWLGNKRLVLIATLLFSLTALIEAFAPDYLALIVAFTFQGLAGGFILSHGLHVFAMLSRPDRRAEMLGLLLCCYFLGGIAGPIVGGWLTDSMSWHWAFLILAPLGLLLMGLHAFLKPKPGQDRVLNVF